MLKVERPTVQQNLNFITTNIALEREGEAQSFFHMGSLIIIFEGLKVLQMSPVRVLQMNPVQVLQMS